MLLDNENVVIWMNAASEMLFNCTQKEKYKERWEDLVFPGGPSPNDILAPQAEMSSLDPFKVTLNNDNNSSVDVMAKKVHINSQDYAACYISVESVWAPMYVKDFLNHALHVLTLLTGEKARH